VVRGRNQKVVRRPLFCVSCLVEDMPTDVNFLRAGIEERFFEVTEDGRQNLRSVSFSLLKRIRAIPNAIFHPCLTIG